MRSGAVTTRAPRARALALCAAAIAAIGCDRPIATGSTEDAASLGARDLAPPSCDGDAGTLGAALSARGAAAGASLSITISIDDGVLGGLSFGDVQGASYFDANAQGPGAVTALFSLAVADGGSATGVSGSFVVSGFVLEPSGARCPFARTFHFAIDDRDDVTVATRGPLAPAPAPAPAPAIESAERAA